jgi:hypothetical protein
MRRVFPALGTVGCALLLSAPGAGAHTALVHGTVASGNHDGGAYRFVLHAAGWEPGRTSSDQPYAFGLRHGRLALTVQELPQFPGLDLSAVTAATASAKTQGQRLLRVDAHHAAVVDRKSRRVIEVYVDANGPFHVVFYAETRPSARQAAAVLDALVHGSHFDWAGPDVRHLTSDAGALPLVGDANAQITANDAFRQVISISGTTAATFDIVRSQHFTSQTVAASGTEKSTVALFFGADTYRQSVGDSCWKYAAHPQSDVGYDPQLLPTGGAFEAYLAPRADGANVDVDLQEWESDALRTTLTLVFDAATHELRSISVGPLTTQYDWHAPITVPARPTPLCAS